MYFLLSPKPVVGRRVWADPNRIHRVLFGGLYLFGSRSASDNCTGRPPNPKPCEGHAGAVVQHAAVSSSSSAVWDPLVWLSRDTGQTTQLQTVLREVGLSPHEVPAAARTVADALMKHFVGAAPRPHCGVDVEARLLNLNRRAIPQQVCTTAAAFAEGWGLMMGEFATNLADALKAEPATLFPIAALCCTSYDETPLSIRVERRKQPKQPKGKSKHRLCSRDSRKPTVSKVLQSDACVVFLVHSEQSGFCSYRIGLPCPLQVMDIRRPNVPRRACGKCGRLALSSWTSWICSRTCCTCLPTIGLPAI
jgi:hypothetical protein